MNGLEQLRPANMAGLNRYLGQLAVLVPFGVLSIGCVLDAPPSGQDMEEVGNTANQPNIIIVLTDDQRHDALGILNPALETPNIDRLAREGLHFSNAFVTTSLCSPSRATLLTGRPMREHGVVDNNSDLPPTFDTFPQSLQRAGYETALVGKWHMGGDDASPRPGFDRWVSFPGQGFYYPRGRFGQVPMLNVDGEEVPQQGYITDELTNYALDWLESREGDPDPYLLYLGHKAVHAFFEPAERHLGMYENMVIEDVTPPLEQMEAEPMWVQNQRNSWHGADYPYHTELSLVEFRRDYYETLTAVDDSLGRLIEWVEQSEAANNTYIVFLSDNGFMFGEHGLIDKRNAFEESMRIPLLIWGGGLTRQGEMEAASVSMLDIAPTLMELAGAETNAPLAGRSLVPFFTESSIEWNDEVIYEYYWEFNYPHTPTQFAIRDGGWKYVRLHGVWDTDALYDIENDPGETINLIADSTYLNIRLNLQRRLHDAIIRGDGSTVVPFTYKFNQGAVFRAQGGPTSAEFPERWVRSEDDPQRLEHFLPDSPEKANILPGLTSAFEENEARIRSQ